MFLVKPHSLYAKPAPQWHPTYMYMQDGTFLTQCTFRFRKEGPLHFAMYLRGLTRRKPCCAMPRAEWTRFLLCLVENLGKPEMRNLDSVISFRRRERPGTQGWNGVLQLCVTSRQPLKCSESVDPENLGFLALN